MQRGVIVAAIIAAVVVASIVVAVVVGRKNDGAPPRYASGPIDHLSSPLSQAAVRQFRTTGGAGICPSLSEYYDPILGYCIPRPKMVYGAQYGGGPCFFDSDCECCGLGGTGGVCDRFGECHCGPGLSVGAASGSYSRKN